jgi:hypothetical protein
MLDTPPVGIFLKLAPIKHFAAIVQQQFSFRCKHWAFSVRILPYFFRGASLPQFSKSRAFDQRVLGMKLGER